MKRVLVICGDVWHPAETVRRGMAGLCADGFELEFVEGHINDLSARLPDYSVVPLAKDNMISAADQRPWLTPDKVVEFRKHLRLGKGLVVSHAGTSRYEEVPEMLEIIGGKFVHHPDQTDVTLEPLHGHLLTAGVTNFTVHDEHYFMAMNGSPVDVFLQSRSRHGVQPAGWTRSEGGGRVCVLTPGHNLEVWLHPSFQKLILNALRWSAKLI
jgi:type 1 glutamine amidotransferase